MGRGILRGACGDENLKSNFIWPYDGADDIQIWAPLTRSQYKVYDTQVPVKACGPLVTNVWWKMCRHVRYMLALKMLRMPVPYALQCYRTVSLHYSIKQSIKQMEKQFSLYKEVVVLYAYISSFDYTAAAFFVLNS